MEKEEQTKHRTKGGGKGVSKERREMEGGVNWEGRKQYRKIKEKISSLSIRQIYQYLLRIL